MGNTESTSKSNQETRLKTLPQVIDYIAANYILTQNFHDMEKLSDVKYCNKLVILTSKVIADKLNDMEVRYLAQRLKDGVEINEMTKDNVIFLNRENLSSLDIQNNTTKRRMCIGIAKFYVKVAHLFAAIVGTINPVYSYKNAQGVIEQVGLLNKKQIPEGVDAKLSKIGLCSSRINALLNGQDIDGDENNNIVINPKFCSMNLDKSTKQTESLIQEPGIPDLKKLYYDVYDYDQGGFKQMSPEMKKMYDEDVKRFYKEYTGEETVPDEIKNFSDIKLRAYHSSSGCVQGGLFTKSYQGNLKDGLFKAYADTIKTMMKNANDAQNVLLDILDDVFVFSFDRVDQKKKIIIHPNLNEKKLQTLVEQARQQIVSLYLTCEKDFVDALEVFEAIVQKQVLDTSKAQLENLDKSINIVMNEPSQPIQPNYAVKPTQTAQPTPPTPPTPPAKIISTPIIGQMTIPEEEKIKSGEEILNKQKTNIENILQEKTENISSSIESDKAKLLARVNQDMPQ